MSFSNDEVVERLDILIALLMPPFNESKYPITGLALEVLKYCDAQNTVDDIVSKLDEIVSKLDKPKNAIEKALTKLRSLNLIRSVKMSGKVYYVRLI